ncbi:hypothetical protein EUGRSUZ_G02243 [Eucalyptus grandis]|uniref:Uncharacterized protein n=2 Tax=Eucalyptus grandis TaxID=71139 RepID=A0ACC3K6Q2_EUCGR|nr:hypothetical protein EUGRSUZ_G02243 [Eucalyptus grandis]
MGVDSSISSKVLLRLVIGILTILSLEDWVASAGLNDESCKGSECGDVMKGHIWSETKPCTNPNFENECRDKPLLNLRPFGEDVVSYENNSLCMSSELKGSGNACFARTLPSESQTPVSSFEPPSSLVFNWEPLLLAFLHDCSSFLKFSNPHSTCPSDGANHSYVALMIGREEDLHPILLVCKNHVILPIKLATPDGKEIENDDYKEKLKHGFRLQWNLTSWESCVECQKSGGNCSGSDGQFLCSCSGKEYPHPCERGCGFGALASFLLCLYIYMIRHKQQHCFLKFCSRHASPDSSSKADLEAGDVYFGVPIFTSTELEEATNHFDSSRELGDGGFGIVYYGKLRDGREVAVKRLYEHNCRQVKQFMTEVEILTRLRHKNLVSLYGCTSRHSRELLLVYEYIPNGTVADHLHGERAKQVSLPWPTRISIAIETATALAYLHASDTIHRDVKTNNILLDNNFSVKVADFGLSRLFPNDVSHVSTAPQGTPGYVDPEYHQCYQLTEKSDVYSFGVVLVELISSMPAVDINRDRHEINLANLATSKIRNHEFCELIDPNLGFESDPEINRMIRAVTELALRCLQQDKDVRPSMETVLEELKAISSGTQEPGKSKDVSYDNSTGQSENLPPSPECDNVELLTNMKSPSSPVSVTLKWGSSGSSSSFTWL